MSSLGPRLAAALAGVAGVAGVASAQTADRGALEALFEEPVTLSATGAPQRITEAPVNMEIITQQDIRRSGAIDLPGVLERLAKIDAMRTSGGQADVSIRGYNSTLSPRLLVLLNGRQVYLDDYGRTNWDAIPVQLSEIRQIEVVSGPNTALFGFNAVAGVINIITYDALQDDIDEASVRVGAPRHAGGSAIWTMRPAENLGVRLSLGGFNADALPGDDAAARAFFGMDATDPQARSVALNAGYDVTDALRADFEATWSRNERTERFYSSLVELPYETNSFKVGLSADTGLGLVSAQAYSNFLQLGSAYATSVGSLENRTTVGTVALVTKLAPAHTLRVAGELRHNELAQGGGDLAYDVRSLSAMWNWQANSALALTTAARVDALDLGRTGTFAGPGFPFTNADYDRAFTEWSYNVGAVYRATARDSLRLSGARGVGLPSLAEYGFNVNAPAPPGTSFFVAGDPTTVAPTIVHNLELSWEREASLINGRVRAAVFWQKNDNLRIFASRQEVVSVSPEVVIALFPQSTGASEMHGIELSAEAKSGPFEWDVRYSWRNIDDALIVSPLVVQANYERTSPEHVITGGFTWVGERFEVGADARYTSETLQYGQGTVLTGLFPVDAYVQANAHVTWNATDKLQLELSGRNLLDSQTQTVGLTPVERSVYLTLRAGF